MDVVRRADSYELLTSVTLALSDDFPAFDFDVFAARAVAAARQYTALQVGIVRQTCPATGLREHLWVRVPASYWATAQHTGFVAREAWHPDAAVDTNADTAGLVVLDGTPLVRVRVRVSTAPDGARCLVRVVASHCVADGRTLASIFDVFRACVPGEAPCVLRDTPLCAHGQRANFSAALPEAALHTVPASWTVGCARSGDGRDAVKVRVLPQLSAEQAAESVYVSDRWSTPWTPLAQYLAARHGTASLQGLLMVVVARAMRRCGLVSPGCSPMVWVTADLRASPYATEAFRTRAFFNNHGSLFLAVREDDDIDADIGRCTEQVRAAVASTDGPVHVCLNVRAHDPATGGGDAAALFAKCPFPDIVVSNIGVFQNMRDPRLQLYDTVAATFYTALYAYRGPLSDQVQLIFCHPDSLDPQVPAAIKEEFRSVVTRICASNGV